MVTEMQYSKYHLSDSNMKYKLRMIEGEDKSVYLNNFFHSYFLPWHFNNFQWFCYVQSCALDYVIVI